jgi:hypothetical protein
VWMRIKYNTIQILIDIYTQQTNSMCTIYIHIFNWK